MKFLSYCILFLYLTCIFSCKTNLRLTEIKKEFKAENILIVSCIQCACINDELERLYLSDKKSFDNYLVIADTNCIRSFQFKNVVKFAPQRLIDSIFPENYNLSIINESKYPNKIISVTSTNSKKIKSKL
jgi:hypothetical protein